MARWLLAILTLVAVSCSPPPEQVSPSSPSTKAPSSVQSNAPSPPPGPSETVIPPAAADNVNKVLDAWFEKSRHLRRYSVYFKIVGSKENKLLGTTGTFEAASLVKLPILAELYRRAEAGQLQLSEKMVFEERFRVGGSGVISDGEAGRAYSLEELGRLMIVQSDNAATDMLLERLGMEAIERNARAIGMADTTVRRTIFDFAAIDEGRDNVTNANDIAVFLEQLAQGSLPGSAPMRAILEAQTRNEMIPAGLPKGTRVAHKTGELTGFLHDAGIVHTPKGDYILVLLGEFDDREQGVRAWKTLSSEVYQAFNR